MSRNQKILQVRDKFYILTNGQETEKNYFELLKSKKSIYEVKVEFHNKSPLWLVKYGTKLTDANQVWCVFDVDHTAEEGTFLDAINWAKKTNIQIAFSNIAFEVWLLSHFDKVEKTMNNNQLMTEMDKLLKNKLGLNKNYDKSDKDLLEKYFLPRYEDAIQNSKIVYQRHIKAHSQQFQGETEYKAWEWNPATTVYKLVEALHLTERNDAE